MWMVALREHGYLGRRNPVGRVFEVRSARDATVLRTARLARDAKKSEIPQPQAVPQPVPAPAPLGLQAHETIVHHDGLVNARDEEPEEIIEESDEASPQTGYRSRKKRRRYGRKDMVSE